jgi:hypothetical protein
MFSPSGERVTGTEFYQPWVGGYSLGTQRPVIGFHATNIGTVYTYLDDLAHPFAWWNAAQSGVQPVSGRVAINDQTGDGIPDLVMAGGVTNGTVILLTLDSTASTLVDKMERSRVSTARMNGTSLEVVTLEPNSISAELVTIDGRRSTILLPTYGIAGVNRFDLSPHINHLPQGAYFLRVLVGSELLTVNLIR